MEKTLSLRIDKDNYEFVKKMAREEKGQVSKAVRELLDLGRVMLDIEKYRHGKVSVGKHK